MPYNRKPHRGKNRFFKKITDHSAGPLADLQLDPSLIKDLLRVCFSDKLDCRLLSRKTDEQVEIVVLVGESHIQSVDTRQLGMKLIDHFQVRGGEGGAPILAPWALIQPIRWLNHTFVETSSLISSDFINLERDVEFTGLARILKNAYNLIFLELVNDWMGSVDLSLNGVAIGIRTILLADTINTLVRGEFGSLVGSRRVRDEAMTRNILKTIERSSHKLMVAAMGANHVFGVRRGLEAVGFTDRGADLMTEYSLLGNDRPGGTSLRDLMNPHDSFCSDMKENNEATYPESVNVASSHFNS